MVGQEIYNRGIGVDSGGRRSRLQLGCTRTGRPATARTSSARTLGACTSSARTVGPRTLGSVDRTCTCGARTIWWRRDDGSAHGQADDRGPKR